ncbi:type II toxin-antitoxin system PemK/MazF family toxin [Aerosakkonema funiforme]|uniref:type II toxin-antitoxin system PemK/MazF family toxin n=1 Tax=Aerosakkonema funiforme TaxID=1246630 RepID=UPI0035BBBD79
MVNLDPTMGAEISKTRPAVIVSKDTVGVLRLKVIVPITEWKEDFTERVWMVRLEPSAENCLSKISAADTFQVRSVSQQRLIQQVGTLSDTAMQAITDALALVLSISS